MKNTFFLLIFALSFWNGFAARDVKKQKNLGVGPHTFDYLLGENNDFSSRGDVIFLDYDIPKGEIQKLLNNKKRVICYVNVGAWEDWRGDKKDFPQSVLGNKYEGWPGERWLDIRKLDILLPIMRKRFQLAAKKGCQGIDPDNINGYSVKSGFPLTAKNQLAYNKAIAKEIRSAGMLAGMKNDGDQAKDLVNYFDFAVLEQCAVFDECGQFGTFINQGKPVFAIEYTSSWTEDDFREKVCLLGADNGMSFILKKLDLHNDYTVSCLAK